jgi:predicted RNase H-like HicB family nuclease
VIGAKTEEVMKWQVILEPSDEGGFTASVPSLPGCISEGDAREDALRNIREAIELFLESVDDDVPPRGLKERP